MKLEIGMFIRTNIGIEKILSVEPEANVLIAGIGTKQGFIQKKRVLKSSFNLIDLIEVGDYVNRYEIIANIDEYEIGYFHQNGNFYTLLGTEIKSILTHEQYNSNCYRIGSDE